MIIRELLRFSTQHRTLYCYMILSIWIFLLIASMYKYIAISGSTLSSAIDSLNGKQHSSSVPETDDNSKYRKFKEHCMPLSRLVRRDDGGLLEGWRLQGVLLVIRHGDCGPMSHLRDVTSINCGVDINDSILNRYRSFLRNSTSAASVNHLYWNKIGPFHGFALLPTSERSCLLGQLTYKGTSQLLHVGDLLYRVYAHPLGLHYRTSASRYAASSSTPHSLLNSDEVVLYTTRYRRTFQSAMALLFSFLPIDKWLALNVLESHSMAFCFTDCACPQADFLRHRLNTLNTQLLSQHQTITALIKWMGSILFQRTIDNAGDDNSPSTFSDSNEVVDAVLTLFCHDAALPCIRRQLLNENSSHTDGDVPIESTSVMESNDVIDIDQDDTADSPANLNYERTNVNKEGSSHKGNINNDVTASSTDSCLEPSHIGALLSYANWQSSREANHSFYKRIGLMRAYGMIRHIVSYMLKMISGDRTKFVLYSGHDWTLQYLMSALGLIVENTFIPYASRLAFEVYRSEMHTDYYFRVVYNGRDVTQDLDFCEGGKSLRITRDSRGNKADLCPIENIIRFLHEDYFSPLNATNFKDACTIAIH